MSSKKLIALAGKVGLSQIKSLKVKKSGRKSSKSKTSY